MGYHIGGWESKSTYGYSISENRYTYSYKDEWNPSKYWVGDPVEPLPDTSENRAYQDYMGIIAFWLILSMGIVMVYDTIVLILKEITRKLFADDHYKLFLNINILILTVLVWKKAFHIIQKERNRKKTEVQSHDSKTLFESFYKEK